MSKTLDDLYGFLEQKFEQFDHRFEQIEQRLDRIDVRLDSLESRMDNLENRMGKLEGRMDKSDSRLNSHEEMLATLIQMAGQNNNLWNDTNERLDRLELRVDSIYEELKQTKTKVDSLLGDAHFLGKKVWEHEKQLFLLHERVGKYLDDVQVEG